MEFLPLQEVPMRILKELPLALPFMINILCTKILELLGHWCSKILGYRIEDMRVTAVRAGRIYNWVRELWMPKDLDWVPSVKAAPVRTGKLTTWIRDALVAASYAL